MFRLFSSSPACLMCRSLPKAFASWRRSSGKLWRATFTTGPLTDVWARHADGCTHINTHAYIRTLHQMWRARLQEENLPWHHPEECRCRAGTGSESQEAWWGRVCHASDGLWESRAKDWVTPRSWTVQGPQLADMLFTRTGISSPPSTIALIKILSK